MIKIAYIDDHRIVKEGVCFLLSQYPDIRIVSMEYEFERLEEFVSGADLDVLILDLLLFINKEKVSLNGFDLCERIALQHPNLKIMAHSMYDEVENVNRFLEKGGVGFISKKSGHQELYEAIKKINAGERYICRDIMRRIKNYDKFIKGEDKYLKPVKELFTRAEKRILEKIARGFSTREIALQLEISEKTVETHRKHLFHKADVKNVAELIAFVYSKHIFME